MPEWYILNDANVAVPVFHVLDWARWFEANTARRRVRRDEFPDGTVVSTVFLGLDHAYAPNAPREIFETMVFSRDAHDGRTERYATWDQAVAGHAAILKEIGRAPTTTPTGPGQ